MEKVMLSEKYLYKGYPGFTCPNCNSKGRVIISKTYTPSGDIEYQAKCGGLKHGSGSMDRSWGFRYPTEEEAITAWLKEAGAIIAPSWTF